MDTDEHSQQCFCQTLKAAGKLAWDAGDQKVCCSSVGATSRDTPVALAISYNPSCLLPLTKRRTEIDLTPFDQMTSWCAAQLQDKALQGGTCCTAVTTPKFWPQTADVSACSLCLPHVGRSPQPQPRELQQLGSVFRWRCIQPVLPQHAAKWRGVEPLSQHVHTQYMSTHYTIISV